MVNRSAGRQKGLTDYCVKYIDRPFCQEVRTDLLQVGLDYPQIIIVQGVNALMYAESVWLCLPSCSGQD